MMTSQTVVVITGASSGIGAATARLLGKEKGCRVVLAARREKRLRDLEEEIRSAGGEALAVPTDVTQLDQIRNLVAVSREHFGRIDVLFNNAGFGRLKALEQLHIHDDIQPQFEVNLLGLIYLTRLVIPVMRKQSGGHIINMSSIAGFIAPPSYTIYSATKYAVRAFTEALRREVIGSGIHVSGMYPGAVDTEFIDHTGSGDYSGYGTPKFLTLSAKDVAEATWKLIRRPRPSVVMPGIMRVVIWVNQLFPRLVDGVIRLAVSLRGY
jgi:short-subunit dehydrogenase